MGVKPPRAKSSPRRPGEISECYARFIFALLSARDGAWVRIPGLADEAGLSRATCYRLAKDLERVGFLRIEWRNPRDGGGIRSAYKVALRHNHQEERAS